jgi:hypothetical protein
MSGHSVRCSRRHELQCKQKLGRHTQEKSAGHNSSPITSKLRAGGFRILLASTDSGWGPNRSKPAFHYSMTLPFSFGLELQMIEKQRQEI